MIAYKMEKLEIENLQPQGDWSSMLDFLINECGWEKESQPLCIQVDYGLNKIVNLLNEFVFMVNICNNIAPIEIIHGNTVVFKSLLTIRQGVLEPRPVKDAENLEDLYHIKLYESKKPYILKIS